MPGRDFKATARGNASDDPDETGTSGGCDYEYERNGTANLFMMLAPLEGWRHIKVTERHTAMDYAHVLKDLADVHFANARTIVLVQDDLNIHSKASLYEAFLPPKPGAWSSRTPSPWGDHSCLGAAQWRINGRRPRTVANSLLFTIS